MWIYRTFGQFITGFKYGTIHDLNTRSIRNQVSLCLSGLRICNDNFTLFLCILNGSNAAELCNNCKSLWLTCLEDFLYTRKTLCNIVTGHTTGMECSHGKLCTRLTDGLCGDNTDRFTNLYRLTGCHVGTVTFRAYTHVGTAGKNGTDLHTCNRISLFINAFIHNIRRTARCNHMVCFNNNISVFVTNCLA